MTNYETLRNALNAYRSANALPRFETAVAKMEAYEVEGVLLATEHKELRQAFNTSFEYAWSVMVREPFFNNGRFQERTEAEHKLEMDLGLSPECHRAGGMMKKVVKATAAAGAMRDAMLAVLREAQLIGERMEALKGKIGKRAPKETKTSIARGERDAKAMTCQCCARGILAETGLIAHHGYERPGLGYQTASCNGAMELPFEVSRDALGKDIEALKHYVQKSQANLRMAQGNAPGLIVPLTYRDYTYPAQPQDVTLRVTAETLTQKWEETKDARRYDRPCPSFDELRANYARRLTNDILACQDTIKQQEQRYAAWKQTHVRKDGAWVALEGAEA
jgi:hypothetical protein